MRTVPVMTQTQPRDDPPGIIDGPGVAGSVQVPVRQSLADVLQVVGEVDMQIAHDCVNSFV